MKEPRIVYVGKLRWRYRWSETWKALVVLWNAIKGYHQTVEWTDDARDDISV